MNETIGFVIAALIGGLTGLFTLLIGQAKVRAEIKKLDAETEKVKANGVEQLRQTVMQLNEPLQGRIQELENLTSLQTVTLKELGRKLEKANRLIRILLRGVTLLMHQLQQLGVTPLFVIPVVNNTEVDIGVLERRLVEEEERIELEERR